MDELMVMTSQKPQVVNLSNATLDQIPDAISKPNYNRDTLKPGIIHIGLGNFHRAHQAWYLHRLMQMGEAHDWAILGAGVRPPYDAEMRNRLQRQDCLTTLIELDPSGTRAEISGSMIDYVAVDEANGPLIKAMSDPSIRIVSLTVTESGYYIDPTTGAFDHTHADIAHDAAHPNTPKTAFGAIVAALKARRDAGTGPFTGQSCDNLQGNGEILRNTVVGLARLSDPDLADWINDNCSFPNSMVDCIVPATGPHELELARSLGIEDAAPVTHENFRQWVIEDDFCAGRPNWDKAGATFSDKVHDYEAMKIRILNAGHQVVANIGELLSLETISDCMAHDGVAGFFQKIQTEGITPYVAPVPGMSPANYARLIESRFANPSIVDTTRRVAFDGSARHPGFVLPILRDAIAAGGSLSGLALVEAFWARMAEGTREDGSQIEPNDPFWDDINAVAKAARNDPDQWLNQSHIYGDIAENPAFRAAFNGWLNLIWSNGSEAALSAYAAQ